MFCTLEDNQQEIHQVLTLESQQFNQQKSAMQKSQKPSIQKDKKFLRKSLQVQRKDYSSPKQIIQQEKSPPTAIQEKETQQEIRKSLILQDQNKKQKDKVRPSISGEYEQDLSNENMRRQSNIQNIYEDNEDNEDSDHQDQSDVQSQYSYYEKPKTIIPSLKLGTKLIPFTQRRLKNKR